jgi:hypothetical protein
MRRLLLVALVAGGGLWSYGQLAAAPAEPASVPSGSPSAEQQLRSAERALAQAQQSGRSVAVTLTFTDADLTTTAREQIPTSYAGFTLSDPAVEVETGTLRVTAQARFGPIGGLLVVTARPLVTDGHAAITLETATVAGVALPDQLRSEVATSLEQSIAALVPAKLRLTSVMARPGVLTVQATAQP